MTSANNRKFPRYDVSSSHRVLQFLDDGDARRKIVLSRNVSATGCCFISPQPYDKDEHLLICVDRPLHEDLTANRGQVIKSGKYVLAKVVWCKPFADGGFDIGCSFIELKESRQNEIDLFIDLVNRDTIDAISI